MPTTYKNKTIGQDFNHTNYTVKEITDFFQTRVENLKRREDKKKTSTESKKEKDKKGNNKKGKEETLT